MTKRGPSKPTKKKPLRGRERVARLPRAKQALAQTGNRGGRFERAEHERERDLVLIAELYLKRYYHWEIAAILNQMEGREYQLARATITADIAEIHARWRGSTLLDYNEAVWSEVDRINTLEREAYMAWFRSVGEREVITTTSAAAGELTESDAQEPEPGKKNGKPGNVKPKGKTEQVTVAGKRVVIKREIFTGESAYLRVVQWCIDKRCDLLGLGSGLGSLGAGRGPRARGEVDEPDTTLTINVELDVRERARRLLGIVEVARRRLDAGEAPPIEVAATEVKP